MPKILIVDDTPANLFTMKKLLAPLSCEVMTADSGNRALTLLLEESCDLILLDVVMPVMNGYEVAELLVAHEETKHLPIIFITARDSCEHQQFPWMASAAIDYLYKPVDPVLLIQKVNHFLFERRGESGTLQHALLP